jgi:predicted TPR repeat methyltransferase
MRSDNTADIDPHPDTLPAAYFEAIYAAHPDPWSFAASDYEAAKYTATLAALPQQHYQHAFEIGCSIGVLTQRLAERCDHLLAVDVAQQALQNARERCSALPQVQFECMQVPYELPQQSFDLIVLSEVGYYLSLADLTLLKSALCARLKRGADLILVHWTPYVEDYPLTGDQVHELFLQPVADLNHLGGSRADTYRIDCWRRTG